MSSHASSDAGNSIVSFEELASLCDEACNAVTSWAAVVDEFIRLVSASIGQRQLDAILLVPYNQIGTTAVAFQYGLKARPDDRANLRDAFAPMAEFSDGTQVPPKLNELPDDVITSWMGLSGYLTHPGAASRINDLLFCREVADAGLHARSAVDAYVNIINSGWTPLEITHALLRAFLLARGMRDESRTARVISSIERHYWLNIRASSPPGITMPLIEGLLESDHLDAEIDQMVSAARDLYREPHLADQLIFWQLRRSRDPEQRERYFRERVMLWLDAAANADPMVRVLYLETAAGYVDDIDDQNLKQQVKVLLQSAGRENLGLKRTASGFTLPQEEVERYVSQFVQAPDWQDALNEFSRRPPPTGNYDENIRLADEIDSAAPFQAVVSRVRLGSDGLPRWQPLTEEDQIDARLARQEELQAQIVGNLFAKGLQRIGEHYSRPSRQALTEYFSARPAVSAALAEQLAAAIDLYWSGEEGAAAYLATLLIEPLLRNILLQADAGIYSVQRRKRPGQYPGLNFLLKELRNLGFDLSWYRYLWTVFASPAGMNLRNEIAHGFASQPGATVAALSIHSACFLSTIHVTRASDIPGQ
jgi:hypothetical protein